jgi:histidyl-tRNA synthetase
LLADEEIAHKRATSVLQVFDVKNEELRAALDLAPKIGDSLCAECAEHFARVRAYLDLYGVPYTLEPTLVRGLDYYTRTAFEFIGPDEGTQASTICGGGRYDYLIEEIGGPATPGIGFGAGIERLILSLQLEGISAAPDALDIFFAVEDAELRDRVLPLLAQVRAAGRAADTDYGGRSLKGQLTQAQRRGAGTIVIARRDGFEVRKRGEEDRVVQELDVAAL